MVEPKKLKVAELREELKSRGLDAKGNKPQLVKRLEKALRQESEEHNEGDSSQNESLSTSMLEASVEEHEDSLNQSLVDQPLEEPTKISPEVQHEKEAAVVEPAVEQVLLESTQPQTVVTEKGDTAEQQVEEELKDEAVEVSTGQQTASYESAEPVLSSDIGMEATNAEQESAVVEDTSYEAAVQQQTDTAAANDAEFSQPPQIEEEEYKEADLKAEVEEPEIVQQQIDEDVKQEVPEADVKAEVEPKEEEESKAVVTEEQEPMEVKEESVEETKVKMVEEQPADRNLDEDMERPAEEKVEESMDQPEEAKKEPTEGKSEEAMEEGVEVCGEGVVGDSEMSTEKEEKDSRKRRRSRSRSRHRSRHSRSRSPRRRKSRSRERRRSDSRERKRSTSRERRHSPERQRRRDRSRSPRQRVSRFDTSPRSRRDNEENEDWICGTNVQWDRFNCDLHIRISDDGYKCNPITVEGFAFMWAGARSNYGYNKGKVVFECKILEHLNVDHLPDEETSRHVVRIGWSADECSMQLGEEKYSYGYGGTGKASTDCKFTDFGTKFGEGDVIACYLDFGEEKVEISYSLNGIDLGKCFDIEKSDLGDRPLFAHVLTKNCEFDVNFGQKEKPFCSVKEDYSFVNDVPEAERVRGTLPPAKKEDCEIVMMCGLPGAGKTYWATKYDQENKDKRYNLLGTNNIIDKMKVMGLPRKRNYSGRWDILIDKSTKCLNRLLEIASKKKRNYILDQTNVYPSAQRRKMRPFEGFQRRAIVIVPDNDEFKSRCEKREKEEGKEIPDNAVWEMKANFCLPEEGQNFDKVEYIELQQEEARALVEKYNKEGEENLPPDYKRFRHDNRGGSYGGGSYGSGSYGSSSYGNGSYGGGGGGNRYGNDRRDYRDRDSGYRGGGSGGRYDNNRDYRDRGSRGGWRGSRGYMGYSSNDRQRYTDKDSSRSYNKYSKDYSQGGGRQYDSQSSSNSSYQGAGSSYNNSSTPSQSSSTAVSSWDSSQTAGWGNQQQGSWGNQSGWGTGNQGWGNQNYSAGWGQQWSGYQQQQQQGQQQPATNTQQQWQGYYNYQYPQQSGWANYNYNYQQPGSTDGQSKQ